MVMSITPGNYEKILLRLRDWLPSEEGMTASVQGTTKRI